MTHKEGEYISLNWECTPDEYYVRGHVSTDVAEAAMLSHYFDDIDMVPNHSEWRHAYARYSMQCTWDDNGHVLIASDEPGRGRFKITMCQHQGESTVRVQPKGTDHNCWSS